MEVNIIDAGAWFTHKSRHIIIIEVVHRRTGGEYFFDRARIAIFKFRLRDT